MAKSTTVALLATAKAPLLTIKATSQNKMKKRRNSVQLSRSLKSKLQGKKPAPKFSKTLLPNPSLPNIANRKVSRAT